MNTTVLTMWTVITVFGLQFGNEATIEARTNWADTYQTKDECDKKAKEYNDNFALFKKIHRTSHCVSVKVARKSLR